MSSESITLMVNGTWESEFRTMFCPRRLMYSETTGSPMTLDWLSTCMEICLPMAICFSRPYQLPMPLAQPTLRLPIASTSSMPPSCGVLVAEGSAVTGGFWVPVLLLALSAANDAIGEYTNANKAAVKVIVRNFMMISNSPTNRTRHADYIPWQTEQCLDRN